MRSLLILFAVVGVAVARPGFLGLGYGARSLIHAPAAYSSVVSPVAYTSVVAAPAPVAVSSQYHAQDELGQYSYGYAGGPSAKSEVKSWDGVTRGGYSYVDAEGKVQNVNYVADAINGFRVAATNLPVAPEAIPAEPLVAPVPVDDTPEVAAAKEAHFALYAEAKAAAEAAPEEPEPSADEPAEAAEEPAAAPVAATPADTLPASVLSRDVTYPAYTYGAYIPASYPAVAPVSYSYSSVSPVVAPATVSYEAPVVPYSRFAYSSVAPAYYAAPWAHSGYSYTAVAPVAAPAVAPVVAPAPITYAVPHVASSQYHAQDEIGQYSYGYAGGPSAKSEVKSWDGVTRGGYSYVDAEGKLQTVNYVADPINGFRVAATNLPVAPVAPEAPVLETIPDTPEVAAAKAEHLAAVEEAKNRSAE